MQSNSGPRPELVLLTGHAAGIVAAAVSPDGKLLATGSFDHSVILWDLASREMLRPPLPHPYPDRLRFSPEGTRLAAFGDGKLTIWEIATGSARTPLPDYESFFLDFEDEHGLLLVAEPGEKGGTLRIGLRNLETGEFVPTWDTDWHDLKPLLNGFHWMGRSADRSMIAGSTETEIRVWNAETGVPLVICQVPRTMPWSDREPPVSILRDERTFPGKVEQLALCSQSRRIAVASYSALWLMDSHSGRRTRLLACGDSPESMAESPDGQTLASGHLSGGLVLWSLPSGRPIQAISAHRSTAAALAYTPDGGRLVSASEKREIKLWDTSSGKLTGRMSTLDASVNSVAFSPDGSLLASGHGDGTVRLWDVQSGSLMSTRGGSAESITAVAFSGDGRNLVSMRYDGWKPCPQSWVNLWTVEPLACMSTVRMSRHPTRSLAVSPDGEYLVHSAAPGETQVWLLHDMDVHYELKAGVAAISPDGRNLATGFGDRGQARLWDLATGAVLEKLELPPVSDTLLALHFSPDGKSLYASTDGFAVIQWNLANGRVIWSRRMDRNYLRALALSPDGQRFAVGGSFSRRIWVRDLPRGVDGCVLQGHRGTISALAFSTDGATLASGSSEDATIKFWDPMTGELRMTLGVLPGDGYEPSPDWICHTPEGKYHGSPGAERFVRWAVDGQFVPPPVSEPPVV